ncbi:MAG: tRNA uridine-5-carboxymethylaminomethyl(34) synthesis enzyme MnmG, partial [Rhodospirillales bacterium]
AFELLSYPDMTLDRLAALWPEVRQLSGPAADRVAIDGRYAAYLKRQEADIRDFRRDEDLTLPADLDYGALTGLSNEVRAKLNQARPATLGAAARISGVTPAALTLLLAHVKRGGDRPARRMG